MDLQQQLDKKETTIAQLTGGLVIAVVFAVFAQFISCTDLASKDRQLADKDKQIKKLEHQFDCQYRLQKPYQECSYEYDYLVK
jgi:hypothetical protein